MHGRSRSLHLAGRAPLPLEFKVHQVYGENTIESFGIDLLIFHDAEVTFDHVMTTGLPKASKGIQQPC
jgi:hypothetical protein